MDHGLTDAVKDMEDLSLQDREDEHRSDSVQDDEPGQRESNASGMTKVLDDLGTTATPPAQSPQRSAQTPSRGLSELPSTAYEDLFEEVSLDLPRESSNGTRTTTPYRSHYTPPPFSPSSKSRRESAKEDKTESKATKAPPPTLPRTNNTQKTRPLYSKEAGFSSSTIDVSGPFWSVLDEDANGRLPAKFTSHAHRPSIDTRRTDQKVGSGGMGAQEGKHVVALSGGTNFRPQHPSLSKTLVKPFTPSSNQQHPLEKVISRTRPRALPPKPPAEEARHLKEHRKMMRQSLQLEEAKAKAEEAKQLQRDKQMKAAIYTWENNVLPHWDIKKSDPKTIYLWKDGIPPRCRERVWGLCIGNELKISRETWLVLMSRMRRPSRSSVYYDNSHSTRRSIMSLTSPIVSSNSSNASMALDQDQERTESVEPSQVSLTLSSSHYGHSRNSDNPVGTRSDPGIKRHSTPHAHTASSGSASHLTLGINHTQSDDRLDERQDKQRRDTSSPKRISSPHNFPTTQSSRTKAADLHREGQEEVDMLEAENHNEVDTTPLTSNSTRPDDDSPVQDGDVIEEDIQSTEPALIVFVPEGPLFLSCKQVLTAYKEYRSDISYRPGTAFLAGMLVLNMEPYEAFICLANLINKCGILKAIYSDKEAALRGYYKVFNVLFAENLPKLYLHFKDMSLTPNNFLGWWWITLFSSILPLELSTRVWDLYFLEGDIIFFLTSLTVLKYLEPFLWGSSFSKTVHTLRQGFVGEERGEELGAVLGSSGGVTAAVEKRFFQELYGVKCPSDKWKAMSKSTEPSDGEGTSRENTARPTKSDQGTAHTSVSSFAREDTFAGSEPESALSLTSVSGQTIPLSDTKAFYGACRNVADYKRLNRIGEGTYGIVYRAEDTKSPHGTVVAMKKIRMERETDGLPMSSLREILLLGKLKHPNVVNVLNIAVGAPLDAIYMVMEYCAQDLATLMDHIPSPFTPGEIKCLMLQLLKGVEFCHDMFIIHRDLKLSNLLLTSKGILKIADFGLARTFSMPTKPMTPKVVTLWYRCPELLFGDKNYTTAVDMWSVGCILGEFLQGTPLLPGNIEQRQIELIVQLIGAPTDKIWPSFHRLPLAHTFRLPDNRQVDERMTMMNNLKVQFRDITPATLSLLNGLLTYDPRRRLAVKQALKSAYFMEAPYAKEPAQLPTYPEIRNQLSEKVAAQEKSERERRKRLAHQSDIESDVPPTYKHKAA
ncbi:hypothetical protein BZG36_02287 [Bifiguratus adelaidae]|uniref:cyclin-dependent kinase n=1 Tax=Bifiguratus adelaidae TaxID=1938954 RepID=A0A261XYI6_9FUNG|nr:hypothetical protein BZG36_02287 [Bifiguratus adelaidae]